MFDEAEVARQRAQCWSRFKACAAAAIDGDYAPAAQYMDEIASQCGDVVAAQARRELWAYVRARSDIAMGP